MSDNPLGRRIITLVIPVESLLDYLSGKIILKLPNAIPNDSKLFSSALDTDHQILKLTLTNDSFERRDFDDPIRCISIKTEPVKPDETTEVTLPNVLESNEDRSV